MQQGRWDVTIVGPAVRLMCPQLLQLCYYHLRPALKCALLLFDLPTKVSNMMILYDNIHDSNLDQLFKGIVTENSCQ